MEDIVEAEAAPLVVAVRFDFSFFFFLLVALSVVELCVEREPYRKHSNVRDRVLKYSQNEGNKITLISSYLDSGPAGAAGGSSAELPRLRFDRRDDDFGGIPSSEY